MKHRYFHLILLLFTSVICYPQVNNFFLTGMANIANAEYTAAESAFTSSIAADTFKAKSFYYRGISRMHSGNTSGAKADFICAKDFNISDAVLMLAKVYAREGNAKDAVSFLEQYIEKNKESNSSKAVKDTSFKKIYSSEDWQNFITSYQVSPIEESMTAVTYFIKKGDYKSAHSEVDKALARNPNSDNLHALKSLIYKAEGLYSPACYEIKKSIEAEPLNTDYLELYGDYCFVLNDNATALQNYETVKTLQPEKFENYLKIARVDLRLDKPNEAILETNGYLRYFPKDTAAQFLSAKINFITKNYTNAMKQLNLLMGENPPRADWFLLRGLAYYETNTYKFAAYDLSMCLDLEPNNPDANYYLGNTQSELGNKELACYYWKRAEKAGELMAIEQINKNCSN
jgi:tetratricopeptide (TPR) repeat protein